MASSLAALLRKPGMLARNPHLQVLESQGPAAILLPPPAAAANWVSVTYTIMGVPMGKPRMTRADKWKKRDCVLRYRAWADAARAATPGRPTNPIRVDAVAFLPMPKSWSRKKQALLVGQLHRQKPDYDNISKALGDALWKDDDSGIACGYMEKRWADDAGPRMVVTIWSELR